MRRQWAARARTAAGSRARGRPAHLETATAPFELRGSSGMEAQRIQLGARDHRIGSGLASDWPGEEGVRGGDGGLAIR